MAITDVAEYAHLSDADVEALAVELDAIRHDIEDSRGARDRAYIQRTIVVQRCLDLAARIVIGASRTRTGWV
ncbi:MAG: NADPH-dependent stearoyl-CoA 9-desaturase, partial [Mycobacterium sp.]|nr:NADPH-dependent stearoyl-CoA 9-desaturase [Mycobacterium sp.]